MQEKQINQVIQIYTKGELKSFSDLYDTYQKMIRSVLYKLCDPDDIEDQMQEVFLKIVKGLNSFKQQSSLKTWVYKIAYHQALDYLKKKKENKLKLEVDKIRDKKNNNQTEHKDLVQNCLNNLSPEHKSVLVMVTMEGLSIKETAAVMLVPEGTIKSRLYHAKTHMLELINKAGVLL